MAHIPPNGNIDRVVPRNIVCLVSPHERLIRCKDSIPKFDRKTSMADTTLKMTDGGMYTKLTGCKIVNWVQLAQAQSSRCGCERKNGPSDFINGENFSDFSDQMTD